MEYAEYAEMKGEAEQFSRTVINILPGYFTLQHLEILERVLPGYISQKKAEVMRKTKLRETVWYLCDGEREGCAKRDCYKDGGWCRWTKDVNHALNFTRDEDEPHDSFTERSAYSRRPSKSDEVRQE